MYRIAYFDDVLLPPAQAEDDLSTGDVESGMVATGGGAIDAYGTRTVWPKKRTVRVRGMYTRPGYWIDHDDNQLVDENDNDLIWVDEDREIQSRLTALQALTGQKKRLWRDNEWDSSRQWLEARLLSVAAVRKVAMANNVLEVMATFEAQTMAWKASSAASDSVALDYDTQLLQVVNDGALTIYDAVLTISNVTNTVQDLRLVGNGCDWTYSTFIGAGDSLVVDAGAMYITRNGAAYYEGMALNSGHSAQAWIEIAPGVNNFYISVYAGTCNVALSYYLQYP